jgi:hypothetical protein
MLRKGVHVSLSWGSLTGAGAAIHMSVPRIIDIPGSVFWAIDDDDVSFLQAKIAAKVVFPTDALSNTGDSLLVVLKSPYYLSHIPRLTSTSSH